MIFSPPTQRVFEIDDLHSSSSSSAFSNRPPSFFAGPQSSSSGESRYTLPATSGTAAIAFDVPPATLPVAAANPNNVVQEVVPPVVAAPRPLLLILSPLPPRRCRTPTILSDSQPQPLVSLHLERISCWNMSRWFYHPVRSLHVSWLALRLAIWRLGMLSLSLASQLELCLRLPLQLR